MHPDVREGCGLAPDGDVRILVLGQTGQLGAELLTVGRRRGLKVSGFGHDQIDVTSSASVEAAIDLAAGDVVINTTAFHVVPECEHRPELALAVNAAGVQILARHCHRLGIGLVTFSTDYVFDGRTRDPYDEDAAPHPLQTYGLSKLAGEHLCRLYHPDSLVIRSCGVYGGATGSRAKQGNFVLSILRASESKSEIEVSSEQIVNPTWARDLAEATLELLTRRPAGGIYHLAAEGHCSWAEFAAEILALAGRAARVVPVDQGGRSGDLRRPLFSALDNRRARALGVVLPHWKEGLKGYLADIGRAADASSARA